MKKKCRFEENIVEAIKNLGWLIIYAHKNSSVSAELENCSPAGEDLFIVDLPLEGEALCHALYENYNDFDEEEHVQDWMYAKAEGISGIPTAAELVEDAHAIKEMYNQLWAAVSLELKDSENEGNEEANANVC